MHNSDMMNNFSNSMEVDQSSSPSSSQSPAAQVMQKTNTPSSTPNDQILGKDKLDELMRQVDSTLQIDEEVYDTFSEIANDFVDNIVHKACQLAKHRGSTTLDPKDIQFVLAKDWNISIPGYGTDELKPYKRPLATEAHKQRLALIRKHLKKY
uniref:Transcription initiation factor TFIID subunit 12 n=1 Tax=Cacopsylla melanoneura TaxID=428564 RepID=A0A8D8LRA1_9HEMI